MYDNIIHNIITIKINVHAKHTFRRGFEPLNPPYIRHCVTVQIIKRHYITFIFKFGSGSSIHHTQNLLVIINYHPRFLNFKTHRYFF